MAERTLGPWEVQPEDDFGFVVSHPGKGDTATFVARTITQANAEAISAVPELLEACHNALSMLRAFRDNSGCIEQLEAAIAKALGKA